VIGKRNEIEEEFSALADIVREKLGAGTELEASFRQKAARATQIASEVTEMKNTLSVLRSIREEKQ
jgi:hypothetical protein